ncbi:MAG TPA: tol-pal system protein YbgF [Steroidobacteraceae bacterium]|nr:tol-pal system protein YbgF [Steroidobacteraceae bacterium]
MYRVSPAFILGAAAAAALGGCATTPEEDPVQIKLNALDTRVTRIERVVANQSLVDLAQHQEAQQAELRELRGQIDQLQHDNATLRKQQHDLYADLDQRVKALGTPGAGSASPAAPSAGSALPAGGSGEASSTEQAIYSQAFDALKAGSYSTAITGFKDFLSTYPQSPLAENAQYWLGESYYVNHDYDSAAEAFRTVLRKWPDSRKGSDALLKLGYTQFEQKQWAAARTTLTSVTQKFPGSDAAKLASEKLKRIPAQ